MRNLKIAYNDIPRSLVTSTASSENTLYKHLNLFNSTKTIFWQTASAVTESTITLDLGSGVTKSAEYIIISGLNHILAQSFTSLNIELRASTDNFATSNVAILTKNGIVSSDLIGSHNEELIITGTQSTAYRYWRLRIVTGSAVIHKARKVYFGSFFDFNGRSPSYPYSFTDTANPFNRAFVSDAGATFTTSYGRSKRKYELEYKGITDAIREDFYTKIGQFSNDFPVYLYEPTGFEHKVFKNKIFFGWLSHSYTSNQLWKDVGSFKINLLEDILG